MEKQLLEDLVNTITGAGLRLERNPPARALDHGAEWRYYTPTGSKYGQTYEENRTAYLISYERLRQSIGLEDSLLREVLINNWTEVTKALHSGLLVGWPNEKRPESHYFSSVWFNGYKGMPACTITDEQEVFDLSFKYITHEDVRLEKLKEDAKLYGRILSAPSKS